MPSVFCPGVLDIFAVKHVFCLTWFILFRVPSSFQTLR